MQRVLAWEWGASGTEEKKRALTETNKGGLIAGEAHPADQRGPGRSDAPVAVIHIKHVSSVQSLQIRPEWTQKQSSVR